MDEKTEELEGYVVDIACLRKYPQGELLQRARVHTRDCVLMGHCVESGYGLIDDEGRLQLVDPAATERIQQALRASGRDRGIRLRVVRREEDGHMRTRSVEEV